MSRTLLLLRLSLITALLSIGFQQAIAQGKFKEGYIRHLDNDIDYGYVQVLNQNQRSTLCRFKEHLDDRAEEYTASQLGGYGYAKGKEYQSTLLPQSDGQSQSLFVETLIGYGSFHLLTSNGKLYLTNKEKIVELTDKNFKEIISNELIGCPYVKTMLNTATLSASSLTGLLNDYNECLEKSPATFRGNKFYDHGVKFSILFGAGYGNWSTPQKIYGYYYPSLYYLYLPDNSANNKPAKPDGRIIKVGLDIKKSLGRKFAIRSGIIYSTGSLQDNYKTTPPNPGYIPYTSFYLPQSSSYTLHVNLNQLLIPIALQYQFLQTSKLQLSVRGGVTIPINVGNKGYIDYTSYSYYSSTATSSRAEIPNIKQNVQLSGGISSVIAIGQGDKINIDLYSEWGRGKINDAGNLYSNTTNPDQPNARTSTFNVMIGLPIN